MRRSDATTTASWAKRPPGPDRLRVLDLWAGRCDLEDVAVVLGGGPVAAEGGALRGLVLFAAQPRSPGGDAAGAVADRAGQAHPFPASPPVAGHLDDRAAAGQRQPGVVGGAGDERHRVVGAVLGADLVVLDEPDQVAIREGTGAVRAVGGLVAAHQLGPAGDRDDGVGEAARQSQPPEAVVDEGYGSVVVPAPVALRVGWRRGEPGRGSRPGQCSEGGGGTGPEQRTTGEAHAWTPCGGRRAGGPGKRLRVPTLPRPGDQSTRGS